MNFSKVKLFLLEFIFACVILSTIIFKINIKIFTCILFAFTIIIFFLIKINKNYSFNRKKVGKVIAIFGLIYVLLLYALGIQFGLYKSYYIFSFAILIEYILPISLSIVFLEIIRSRFLIDKTIRNKIFITILFVLADYILFASFYNLSVFSDFRDAIFLIILSSISSNLLYNYLCPRFGYKYIIIYRFITILYIYFIPVIPNISAIFDSFIRLLFPYIMYRVLYKFFDVDNNFSFKKRIFSKFLVIIIIIISIIYLGLVSGEFGYGALVVGSSSMSKSINKGDVVIYKKYNENVNISKGDIIIFKMNKLLVVHRIIKIEDVNGQIRIYTKGDNNDLKDDGYRILQDVVGIVKNKIDNIGIFSIKVRELFE